MQTPKVNQILVTFDGDKSVKLKPNKKKIIIRGLQLNEAGGNVSHFSICHPDDLDLTM